MTKQQQPAAPTWEHRGVKITVSGHGYFVAQVRSQVLRSQSLDAIKKRIDGQIVFTPFTALVEAWVRDDDPETRLNIASHRGRVLRRVTVDALHVQTERFEVIDDDSDRNKVAEVIADTPENITLWLAHRKIVDELAVAKERLDDAEKTASAAVHKIRADKYQVGS